MAEQSGDALSYQRVASAADHLLNAGKKINTEAVRRTLGFGHHAQISQYLRKWRAANGIKGPPHKGGNKRGMTGRNAKKGKSAGASNRHQSRQGGPAPEGETYAPAVTPSRPFSLEWLEKQSSCVQALFWAIYMVRSHRSSVLEETRCRHEADMTECKEKDAEIRAIKRQARDKTRHLYSEMTRVRLNTHQEIERLRNELDALKVRALDLSPD